MAKTSYQGLFVIIIVLAGMLCNAKITRFLLAGKICPILTSSKRRSKVMVIDRTTALQLPGIYWCGQLRRNLPKCLPSHPDAHIKSASQVLHGKTFRLEWSRIPPKNKQFLVKLLFKSDTVFLGWVWAYTALSLSLMFASLSLTFLCLHICVSLTLNTLTVWVSWWEFLFGSCRLCVRVCSQACIQVLYIS